MPALTDISILQTQKNTITLLVSTPVNSKKWQMDTKRKIRSIASIIQYNSFMLQVFGVTKSGSP